MASLSGPLTLLALLSALAVAYGALPEQCNFQPRTGADMLNIPISVENVAWGYSWKGRKPVAYVQSGEVFTLETGTQQAGDYYEGMVKGDPAMEAIYHWTSEEDMAIKTRGANGATDGRHVLTGNVYVCGAEPGDTVEIRILDMKPRLNPSTGRAYAANAASGIGFQYRTGFRTTPARDSTVIYRIFTDPNGYAIYAAPEFQFAWKDANGTNLVEIPCIPLSGTHPGQAEGYDLTWSNPNSTFSGNVVKCENGKMKIGGPWIAGAVVNHPIGTEDYSVKGTWRVPVMPHIGNLGITNDYNRSVSSAFPTRTAGNLDHKRLGKGSRLFVPVEVEGALMYAGDVHAMQGHGEYCGTGLESSWHIKFQVIVHKKADVEGTLYGDLAAPILENDNEWCFHGFTFMDYLRDPRLGAYPPATVAAQAAGNIYQLMNNTGVVARDSLMKLGFNEDSANSILTAGCDWEVTQVVNGNWGQNICCYKYLFQKNTTLTTYIPKVFPGTSRPWKLKLSQSAYL